MKAQITIYVDPVNRKKVLESLAGTIGNAVTFFPDQFRLLSWVGETEIEVANQQEAFQLERELQQIDALADVEVVAEDTPEEEEINDRYARINETIHAGKALYPHPYWYHHEVHLGEALDYAESEFKAGRGFFDINKSRSNVGLIDTGYTLHPEIAGMDIRHGHNFMPGESMQDPLDTLENTRPLPIRWGGHGTSCASLLIGQNAVIPPENRIYRKNTYFDDLVNGLLPANVNVVPYRVSKNIISFTNRMSKAICHIAEKGDTKVISMSHATLRNSKSNYAAVREAYEHGITLVAAPGSHVFASRRVLTYPARYEETIAPAASTFSKEPWRLTHGGPEVDLCAPGFEIYIPWPFKDRQLGLGYVYKWSEGSSFAVPIVATAAALWRMHHGSALDSISPMEQVELFRTVITKTATPFAGSVEPGYYGAGIINFHKMLKHPLERTRGLKSASKMFRTVNPEQLFRVNKTEASLLRELAYLKTIQFVQNPVKALSEMDFYQHHGTDLFKTWLRKRYRVKQIKCRLSIPCLLDFYKKLASGPGFATIYFFDIYNFQSINALTECNEKDLTDGVAV